MHYVFVLHIHSGACQMTPNPHLSCEEPTLRQEVFHMMKQTEIIPFLHCMQSCQILKYDQLLDHTVCYGVNHTH